MCRLHVVALAAGLLAVAGCRRTTSTEDANDAGAPAVSAGVSRAVRVDPGLLDAGRLRTAVVRRRVPTGSVRLPADVIASAEGAAEAGTLVAGRVARFEVREGDRVKRGQVLAWLDAPEAAKAVAELLRARARTETLARKVARLEALVSQEATSALAVDEARMELEIARADLAAARTVTTSFGILEPAAGTAPAIAAQLPVRSPVDGIVAERAVPLGAHVAPDTKLFRLLGEGRVLVDARLADGAPVLPTPGMPAEVQPRGGAPCPARVVALLPQVETATRTRRVRLAPEGSGCAGLLPGAQAEVAIALGGGDAGAPPSAGGAVEVLVVPAPAAVEVRAATFVFVALSDGSFVARPVEVGPRVGDDLVIRAGLQEGETVVIEGAVLLKGELIRSELGGEP